MEFLSWTVFSWTLERKAVEQILKRKTLWRACVTVSELVKASTVMAEFDLWRNAFCYGMVILILGCLTNRHGFAVCCHIVCRSGMVRMDSQSQSSTESQDGCSLESLDGRTCVQAHWICRYNLDLLVAELRPTSPCWLSAPLNSLKTSIPLHTQSLHPHGASSVLNHAETLRLPILL